jgi:hypothetical protein
VPFRLTAASLHELAQLYRFAGSAEQLQQQRPAPLRHETGVHAVGGLRQQKNEGAERGE